MPASAPLPLQQMVNAALQHLQAKRWQQAESLSHQLLSQAPNWPEAHFLAGVIAHQEQQFEQALLHYQQTIALQPDHAQAHCNLGAILRQQGQGDAAIHHYRQAIDSQPTYADAHYNLGNLLLEQGELATAIDHYQQAISLRPQSVPAYCNLGYACLQLGQFATAIHHYRKALALQPQLPFTHYSLGNALKAQGELAAAIRSYQQAIQLAPDYADAHYNLARALAEQGDWMVAIDHYRQVLALKPEDAETYLNLGIALAEVGQLEASIAHLRQSLQLRPDSALTHHNLGLALTRQGNLETALIHQQQALILEPNYELAHFSYACTLLLQGNLPQGFAEYEWRLQPMDYPYLTTPPPLWDGSHLEGKTILLRAEQGFGDTLQFIRYAPLLAAQGGRVLVVCPPSLVRLLQTVAGVAQVIPEGEAIPPCDYQIPLMSLPHRLGTTLDTIPTDVPYLQAPPPSRVLEAGKRLKVGLVWASGRRDDLAAFRIYQEKTCPLEKFRPLLHLAGIRFYSLQVDRHREEIAQLGLQDYLEDLSPSIQDFADTASLMAQLDLVISVDTAAAHLSAALGRPTWILLPFAPDWRWLLRQTRSPWYPTSRLFRQQTPGEWSSVIYQLAEALKPWWREV